MGRQSVLRDRSSKSETKSQKKSKDAKERITCTCPCPGCTCKSPCSSSSTCTCTSSSSIPPSSSSCSSTCSCSSPSTCSSCSSSPSPTRPDGPDGRHRWWSRCRLCRGPRRRQLHHWHVLWWLLTSTCTCGTCSCTSCTSCTSSRAKRANWTVRLGDQAVLAVQPGPVRHHPLRRVQRGAQRMQAEEPDDSLDFQDIRIFPPLQVRYKLCGPIDRVSLVRPCDRCFFSEAWCERSSYIQK